MNEIKKILQSHALRATPNRNEILHIFIDRGVAMSESEVEKAMKNNCDRVTIYRTLSTFLEKGIVHKVLDDSGVMKYALCAPSCHDGPAHSHDHVHFKCIACGNTTCIEDVHIPAIQLPDNYQIQEVNVLMQGTCAACT